MPNVRLSFGPMLIGVFLNMILYGVLLVQTYTYYQTYKKDTPWIKYLVVYLFIIETANTVLDIHIVYEPLILRYGTVAATTFFPTLFASEPLILVAVSTPIQLFFAWRIKVLTKNNWIAIFILLLSFVSLGGGIWTAVKIINIKLFLRKPELHTPALIWFLSSCVADIVITIALVLSLSRRRTGFVATDDAISKIIRMTVQTGMLTALFAVGDVVFFMTLPHTALNFIWDLALSKLYSNCLLSTLNARVSLNELTHGSSGHRVSSNHRRTDGFFVGDSNHIYELDTTAKSFEVSSSSTCPRADIEYGITVTKVVETGDPRPSMHMHQTTQ